MTKYSSKTIVEIGVMLGMVFDEYHDVIGYIVVLNDLTEKRDIIQKLQVSEHEAEMANHAKSNFLARMSHEIRTPINGVVGMNEMILQKSTDEQRPVSEKTFNFIEVEKADDTEDGAQEITLRIPGKRILVVDDNEINRIVASELLAYTEADIDVAEVERIIGK